MTRYTVTAQPWQKGWELHIKDVGVTQVKSLARATDQARDYIETLTGDQDAEIELLPSIGDLSTEIVEAKQATASAAAAQQEAAGRTRNVITQMRKAGFSVNDIAVIMDLSRGRISQLS